MKLAIITLHRLYNYGSVLQAYATQRIFERKGYDTVVIDYITEQRTLKRQLFGKRPHGLKGTIHRLFKPFSIFIKEQTFGRFIKKNLNITQRCVTFEDLQKLPPFDIYVTGSDQTWNSFYNEGVDRGFFLDFTDSNEKYAFAASFGKNELDPSEKEQTKQYLSKYKAISTREIQGKKILDDLGFTKSVCIIDPTLQIDKQEWLSISSKRLIKKKYVILMLLYQEDNGATEYARKIADDKGFELVKISWEFFKPKLVDKLMTHRTPNEFLSLFNYAEFVVTNSFHGLAFSINLNKQFVIVPRNEFNSRINSLLSICGLESRLVKSMDDVLREANSIIDYQIVNERLNAERKLADKFIEDNFFGVNND